MQMYMKAYLLVDVKALVNIVKVSTIKTPTMADPGAWPLPSLGLC